MLQAWKSMLIKLALRVEAKGSVQGPFQLQKLEGTGGMWSCLKITEAKPKQNLPYLSS